MRASATSYKTRKPSHDVVRYRKSAQRLREMGRREEAMAFEAKAAKMDEEAEIKWRTRVAASITSSAWGGSKVGFCVHAWVLEDGQEESLWCPSSSH